MSQAETLLNTLAVSDNIHTHTVSDSDAYFVIDPVTRVIEHPSYESIVLMQRDHNSSVFTFELPRYVDGHDMTLCTAVKAHYNNISADAVTENADVADLYDLRVNPKDTSKVICSWTIHRQATQLVGTLNFLVQYLCTDSEGNETYEWHTDIYSAIEVRQGRNNGPAAIIEYTDILEQWRAKMFGAKDSLLTDLVDESEKQQAAIVAEGESQVAAIELKGAETLATIPEDYTATYNLAEEAYRKRADAIVSTVSGETITMNDASDNHVQGLKTYGKTEQFTTTGKNLLDVSADNSISLDGYENFTSDNGVIEITNVALFGFKLPVVYGTSYAISLNKLIVEGVFHFRIYEYIGEPTTIDPETEVNYIARPISNSCASVDRIEHVYSPSSENVTWIAIGFYTDVTNTITNFQVEIGDVITEYEPYTGGMISPNHDYIQEMMSIENPTINIYGKNLLDITSAGPINYATTVERLDNSLVITITNTNPYGVVFPSMMLPAGVYTLSCTTSEFEKVTEGRTWGWRIKVGDSNWNWPSNDDTYTFTIDSDSMVIISYYMGMPNNNLSIGDSITIHNPQLEIEDVATAYKPYTKQNITMTQTLHGIPVSSDGNYTDSNGQQWIADYVDCENKQLIHRIGEYVNDGSNTTWGINQVNDTTIIFMTQTPCRPVGQLKQFYNMQTFNWTISINSRHNSGAIGTSGILYCICSIADFPDVSSFTTYLNENPLRCLYVMAEPVTTDLTADEITAYKALRTNYVNTTVVNDRDAYMEVSYAADTETYINNNYVPKSVMDDVLLRLAVLEAK